MTRTRRKKPAKDRAKRREPRRDERCPGCGVLILETGGEVPTAVFVAERDAWCCSNCYDAHLWPIRPTSTPPRGASIVEPDLTPRDQFALAALPALIRRALDNVVTAEYAYGIADAMLARRRRP